MGDQNAFANTNPERTKKKSTINNPRWKKGANKCGNGADPNQLA